MEMYYLLLIFLLSSLFFLSKLKTRKQYSYNYNLPPSPPKLPIVGNLHQLGKIPHQSLFKLSEKYGPVMFLQLGQVPTVIVSSPETAKQVLKTHDSLCCSRHRSYGAAKLSYNLLDIAFGPYTEYWVGVKKLCVQEVFAAKRVQSFSHVRGREVSRLISSISKSAFANKPIELDGKLLSLTKNIICSITFGRSYEEHEQFGRFGNFKEVIDEAMTVMSSFWTADFFPTFGWVVDESMGLHRRLRRLFSDLDTFFESVIEEHLDPNRSTPPEHNKDVLDVLLGLAKDETSTVHLSRESIKALLMNLFIGAIESSADTVVWAMTELVKNPTLMRKAQLEIRSHVGNKPLVPHTEIINLKYLKLVLKETLRMHLPGTLLIPRESMQDFKINGYDVPAKTRIYVNAWAIGRDPEIWENPNEFSPERFEGSDVDFRGQHFEFIPFGAGRRMCPGMTMGMTNVEFTLANLLHCFDWELPVGVKAEDVSVEEEFGLSTHKKYPLCLVPVLKRNLE